MHVFIECELDISMDDKWQTNIFLQYGRKIFGQNANKYTICNDNFFGF